MSWAFVGSYAAADDAGIHAVAVGPTGEVGRGSTLDGIVNPSFVAIHPSGRHLFAVSEKGGTESAPAGEIFSFRIETAGDSRRLIPVERRVTRGDFPCHISVDRSGRWVAVSNYGSGNVVVLPVASDGALGDPVAEIGHQGRGARPDRQSEPHAHSALFSPDNRHLLTADLGSDRITICRFDEATGRCDPRGQVATAPGAGPRHMTFHPDGIHLLVVNELDSTLALCRFHGGELTLVDRQPTVDGSEENLAADVHVLGTGRYAYVSNRGSDTIAVFEIHRRGSLRLVAEASTGGSWPRSFAIDSRRMRVVVANQHSDEVVVLPLDDGGSTIGAPIGRLRVPQPASIALLS